MTAPDSHYALVDIDLQVKSLEEARAMSVQLFGADPATNPMLAIFDALEAHYQALRLLLQRPV